VQKKDDYHQQILLKSESVGQPMDTNQTNGCAEVNTINVLEPALQVVDQVLSANRSSTAAEEHRKRAQAARDDWNLQDGLLLNRNRLFVPDDDPELRTRLLDEVYARVSTAHPGRTDPAAHQNTILLANVETRCGEICMELLEVSES